MLNYLIKITMSNTNIIIIFNKHINQNTGELQLKCALKASGRAKKVFL